MLARRTLRPALVYALACALVACTISGPATALAADDQTAAALAQERYYMGGGTPEPSDPALVQESYYSSYGAPEPLTLPQAPAPADDAPWLPISGAVAIALLLAVGMTQLRRLRLRRRRAARAAA